MGGMRTVRTDLLRKRARHAGLGADRALAVDVAGQAVARAVPGPQGAALPGRAVPVGRGLRVAAIEAPAARTGAAPIEVAVSAGGPTTARTAAAPLAR